jgi:hypothetical protein
VLLATTVLVGLTPAAQGATTGPRGASVLPSLAKVAKWINAGVHVSVASSSVLKQLPNDELAWIPDSQCLTNAINSTNATPCVMGDTASSTTVVDFGDSTADQWALDVAALGTSDHFRVVVYVKAGCPVGSILVKVGGQSVDPSCAAFRSTVLGDLAGMRPAPSLVLISELRLSNYETPTGGRVSNSSWSSGLATTVRELEKDGLAVAVLHGVPVATIDPANCIAVYPRAVTRCTTVRKKADPSGYSAATLAGALAGHAAGVDVEGLFCTKTACPDIADGDLTHAGVNHVDETYAKVVGSALGELLGCVTTQHFTNRTAASKFLKDLDGAKPSAAFLKACAELKP